MIENEEYQLLAVLRLIIDFKPHMSCPSCHHSSQPEASLLKPEVVGGLVFAVLAVVFIWVHWGQEEEEELEEGKQD